MEIAFPRFAGALATYEPYFRVVDPHSLTEDRCSFELLEADKDFHVTREAIETFEPLVERFLVNGKINSQSISI